MILGWMISDQRARYTCWKADALEGVAESRSSLTTRNSSHIAEST